MTAALYLILLLVIALPIAWFASEFQSRRWLRLLLGSTAIIMCFGVAHLSRTLTWFEANAWFGSATYELVSAVIEELEADNRDTVVDALRDLREQYHPTYEHRARYDLLAKEAIAQMKGASRRADVE